MSLFADRQLIEIRIPSGKPGKDGSEALQRYCETRCRRRRRHPGAAAAARPQQQASAWFGALDGAGVTVRVDPIERKALPPWIAQRLARAGPARRGRRRRASARWPSSPTASKATCSPRTRRCRSSALLYPRRRAELRADRGGGARTSRATTSSSSARRCSPARSARALRMLDGLQAEGEAAVLVHWTLAEDIRALEARAGRGRRRQAAAAGAARGARLGRAERLFERALPLLGRPRRRATGRGRAGLRRRWSRACSTRTGRPTRGTALQRLVLMVLRAHRGTAGPHAVAVPRLALTP